MSSTTLIGAAVMIFIVAALLYYQSHTVEAFDPNRSTWNPSQPPIAGRQYNPQTHDNYAVPGDLSQAPVSAPQGNIPTSQQRPNSVPGGGTSTMPPKSLAQLKDLRELDSKITTWLAAYDQKDREQPGSLTHEQNQEHIILQGRLREIRDQIGTGMIVDTWRQVADETLKLRTENQGWQQMSPSLDEVYEFGKDSNPDAFLTKEEYIKFFAIFNTVLMEMQGLTQPNPLQKVRLQQIQVTRQELIDIAKKQDPPRIKMGAARNYLQTMLKPDQPLPTLFSMESAPVKSLADNPIDILSELKNMEWELELRVKYDPVSQGLKRAMTNLMNKVQAKEISPQEARGHLATMKNQTVPMPFGNPIPTYYGGARPAETSMNDLRKARIFPEQQAPYNPTNLVKRANTLCKQIEEAFPEDAAALGCVKNVKDDFEAETVINNVCERLRYSVPTVTPEQFGCPARNV